MIAQRDDVEPADLERVKEILDRAMGRPAGERTAFVRQACATDEPLRHEVASLLRHDTGVAPWPEGPLVTMPENLSPSHSPGRPQVGQRFGPYRVEGILGEGGMGFVARARREDDFDKPVALKVVHTRLSEALIARFRVERQVLAGLEHPNIARILDGGTAEDGRPYFAMALVQGEPIDRYCQRHALSVRDRLRLVRDVCAALDLAHRNLIVHRDIKPGNILVTADGVPMLLDFGIAKRLRQGATQLTGHQQRLMTLRYASPEQVDGGTITTATDVYGVGLLLFQLLTERYPYTDQEDSDLRLAAAIRGQVPLPMSAVVCSRTHRRALEGDLDAIVAKALRKEPARRYASIAELADDLARHVEGRPVRAHVGNTWYQVRRYANRHRLVLCLALASLLVGAGAMLLWQRAESMRAQAEKARAAAVTIRDQKQQAFDFLERLLRGARPDPNVRPGARTAFDLLRDAEHDLGSEAPLVQAQLLGTIGDVYTRWGRLDDAGRVWQLGAEVLEARFPDGHPELAKALNNVASWHLRQDRPVVAADGFRRALAMKLRLPASTGIDVAKTESNLASALMAQGQYDEAAPLYARALARRKAATPVVLRDVGQSLRNLAVLQHERGDLVRAESLLRETLATLRRADPQPHDKIATTLNGLGRVLHDAGRLTEAQDRYQEALALRRQLYGKDHRYVILSHLDLARLHHDAGDRVQAERALGVVDGWLRDHPDDLRLRGRADGLQGALLTQEGRYADAEPLLLNSLHRASAGRLVPDLYSRRARQRLELLYSAWGRPEQLAALNDASS